MDEDTTSWIVATVVLSLVTASLTIYQVRESYILQPTFFFFVFQLSTLISFLILFSLLVKKHLTRNKRKE